MENNFDKEKEIYRFDSEELEIVNLFLDEYHIPKYNANGVKYSTIGRIKKLMNQIHESYI